MESGIRRALPAGVLGIGGPNGAAMSIVYYAIGLAISYITGYVVTNLTI